MKLTVQQIAVNNETDRKSKLAKMRLAVKNIYDFHIDGAESLVRFSSDTPGPILPQIYLEKIKEQFEDEIGNSKFNILLSQSNSTLLLIECSNWEVYSLKVVLADTVHKALKPRLVTFLDDKSVLNKYKGVIRELPKLTSSEINQSPYQFKDKFNKKLVKNVKIGSFTVIGLLICYFFIFGGSGEEKVIEPTKKVVEVKKIRKDNFYEYKKAVIGRVVYTDVYPAMITAVLMASKVPENWSIEEVSYEHNSVYSTIKHYNGETSQLKYFRDSLENGRFITVDGQSSIFQYPIMEPSWFPWTKHKSNFVDTRDQYMDLMITLGGKMRSNVPVHHAQHSDQLITFYFDEVSIIYLELFNYIFENKPIFIENISVKPLRSDKTKATIEITTTVLGV